MIKRIIHQHLLDDLNSKIIIMSGPRQCGKTTLSKNLLKDYNYLNFDIREDRKNILAETFHKKHELIIFDEIHKMKKWKTYLKGLYDQRQSYKILVTGSARLDLFKKGGDSLAGRHFFYKLNPFTYLELRDQVNNEKIIQALLNHGGFPEPLLASDPEFSKKWRASHIDRVIRDDVLNLESKGDIKSLQILFELLQERVGSTVSYSSLAEDLRVSVPTIKKWLDILEQLFIVFKVMPFSKNISRAILKESKYYFYDIGNVLGNTGQRFENLVACELKFYLDYLESTKGEKLSLNFIRDKEKREVDFVVSVNKKLHSLIEVKTNDENFSKSLLYFSSKTGVPGFQVNLEKIKLRQSQSVRILEIRKFLDDFKINLVT